jgi:hypothetical protein
MKTKFKISLALVATCVAALSFSPVDAFAQNAGKQSLQATQFIGTATIYSGNPTNTPGTNGNGFLTGVPIDIRDYALGDLGIEITGTNTIGGATNINSGGTTNMITIDLVRAFASGGTPTTLEFETTKQYTLSVPVNGTSFVNWRTNLDNWFTGPASHIGAVRITNTCSSGSFVGDIKITKKRSVTSWP